MCEEEGRRVPAHLHLHRCVCECLGSAELGGCPGTSRKRMRISALVSLAKAFWGPPSHLVEYLYLDHVGVNTQARKTFSFRKISMTFLRGKGRENGRIKVCVPFCRGSEAQKEQGICPRLPVGGIAGEDQGQGLDLQAWDGISARWLG